MNWQEILAAILMVAVVIIAIFIFTGLYKEIFGGGIFGGEISQEEQEFYESNFDKLETNILACKVNPDTNCLCEGFPSFPGTFKGKLHFTSEGRDMLMELEINKNTMSSTRLQDVYVTGVLVEKQGLNFEEVRTKIDIYFQKWIDFTKEPPRFDREGLDKGLFWGREEPGVVDSRLYKNEQGIIHIMLANDKSPEVQYIINGLKECGEEE